MVVAPSPRLFLPKSEKQANHYYLLVAFINTLWIDFDMLWHDSDMIAYLYKRIFVQKIIRKIK
ncbi:hypothetical protein DVG78_26150 [Runella aurantiaca]|uniref:Uncharacterized protein n=1 Tax=Runella aurantiaca TaxID=2282308 RepID=A0A369I1Q4_9BACT|nr:hypothetical protein DVG78_26150 [Runella aurantiaca]